MSSERDDIKASQKRSMSVRNLEASHLAPCFSMQSAEPLLTGQETHDNKMSQNSALMNEAWANSYRIEKWRVFHLTYKTVTGLVRRRQFWRNF